MSIAIKLTVNGKQQTLDVDPRSLLVSVLREQLGLTGTHVGCDTSQCGACVVHLDGVSVKSCTILAAQADGADVVTIEGLADGGAVDPGAEAGSGAATHQPAATTPVAGSDVSMLHPMQQAFHQCHGLQCGFCTPGMVMSAIDLAKRNPDPTDAEIREWLEGNLCRCTGYQNIVKSIREGARLMREQA